MATSSTSPARPLAVVVGAGGLGRALARRLGERYRLLLADRDAPHLDRVAEALRGEGHDVAIATCDVTDDGAVAALAEAVAANGPMRALAHVVGLSPSMADWQAIMDVDLAGAARVERALLPLATRETAAVFISSLAAHAAPPPAAMAALLDDPLAPGFLDRLEGALSGAPHPGQAYGLAKWGLNRLCRRRAAAWAARGARINSLSPGLIATPMGAIENAAQPAKQGMLEKAAGGREGTMLEIADAVEFLLSDRASYITGTDLLVDGGVAAAMAFPT